MMHKAVTLHIYTMHILMLRSFKTYFFTNREAKVLSCYCGFHRQGNHLKEIMEAPPQCEYEELSNIAYRSGFSQPINIHQTRDHIDWLNSHTHAFVFLNRLFQDFELNELLNRHFKVCMTIVDENEIHPELKKDIFWNQSEPEFIEHPDVHDAEKLGTQEDFVFQ